jgi:uncharacterized protein DUF3224
MTTRRYVKTRPRWKTTVITIVATMALAQPALATGPSEGSGSFTFTAAPTVTVTRMAGGNTFFVGSAPGVIAGAISGAFTEEFRNVVHPNGSTNLKGSVVCTCSLGGRSGIFEIDFVGRGAGTVADPFEGQLLLQNGTGGLAGIHGVGTFRAFGPGGTYEVRWHFEP